MTAAGHIFLSYRSLERPFAVKLAAGLQNAGVAVWLDRFPTGIKPGDDWPQTLEDALNACHAFIVVLSPGYSASKVCRRELHRADQLGRVVFPVLLEPLTPEEWPLEIERLQYVDFTNWHDERFFASAFEQLLARVRADTAEVIGQRPDQERQYLLRLTAEMESRIGVSQYVRLDAEFAAAREDRRSWQATRLDPEFLLLEQPSHAAAASAPPRRLDDILEIVNSPRRVVVLGDPGAGKTTTLRRLVFEMASARLADGGSRPLPIHLHLGEWRTEPHPLAFIEAHWPFKSNAGDALATGEAILFLDGLNEMGAQGIPRALQLRQWFASREGPMRSVITCRLRDYSAFDLGIDTVRVQPMDEGRIRAFAAAYLDEDTDNFLQRLHQGRRAHFEGTAADRSLWPLARNPYLLTALIVLYRQDPKTGLPANRGGLFRRLAEFLWTRELSRQTRGWMPFVEAERCFARLAFRMIEEKLPTVIERRYAEEPLAGEGLIHAGLRASILDGEGDGIRYYHQSMQEYFAAVELMRAGLGERVNPQEFESGGWYRPWASGPIAGPWDEVVVAAAGLANDPSSWIHQVAARNIHLAARCAITVDRVDPATVRSLLNSLVGEHSQASDNIERHRANPPGPGYDSPMGQDAWEGYLTSLEGRRDYAEELIRMFATEHRKVVEGIASTDDAHANCARRALSLLSAGTRSIQG